MLHGGRWNSVGMPVIYGAETYAGAMLEVLVHANLSAPPRNQSLVRIVIPEGVAVETVAPEKLPGWDAEDAAVSRAFGDAWLRSLRSVALRVPSVVTAGREYNVMINPRHRDFARVEASTPEEVRWDVRLFGVRP